ncbi:MAG TPA: hypothetical protein PKA36_17175 [Pseudoxanthomonas mexicana]|nr:hypothetical protein [Pseudoxanthomonas mexicana]
MADRHEDYYNGPIWQAFGLTRAAYAVFPRRALQSMPAAWQQRLVDLINEMHDTLDPDAVDANWQLRVGSRFTADWRADYRHTGPLPLRTDAGEDEDGR